MRGLSSSSGVGPIMTTVTSRAQRSPLVTVPIPHLQGRGMTMSDQLARHARHTPEATALRFEAGGRSYGDLDERVTRLARALADRGVGAGARIAVLALNGLEVWEAYL